jgi:manganese/zinc/iron transport system substrate-binding protein
VRMAVGIPNALLAIGLVAACAGPRTERSGDASRRPVRAVATTGMVADLVRNIGGDRVQVDGLMGPGVDPHLYKASEGDVIRLAEADIIFYSGLHLEAKLGDVLARIGDRVTTVPVTRGIDASRLLTPAQFEGSPDPHVWFDVAMWMQTIPTVRDALIAKDPAGAATYRANAERYRAELEALDAYAKSQAARVPPDRRVLVTAHDAFNYFGRAYGFDVRGLQGISTAAEAGTRDVKALAEMIAARRVPAIFVESSVPVRNIEAVRAAAAARGAPVTIGGELYADALGDAGTPDGTYVGVVRHNVDTIVNAILGQ